MVFRRRTNNLNLIKVKVILGSTKFFSFIVSIIVVITQGILLAIFLFDLVHGGRLLLN